MKNLIKILSILIISTILLGYLGVDAKIPGLDSVQNIDSITDHSITIQADGSTISDNIKGIGFNILTMAKYIISGLLVIFMVYVGVQIIMSMGTDEEELGKAKKQLRYTTVGLIFINIPGTVYNAFVGQKGSIDGGIKGTWYSQFSNQEENIFINTDLFNTTLNGGIINFIEVVIFTLAIFMIMLAGLRLLGSRGNEEVITESKNKIIWSIVGLVFIGFIESWQALVYSGKVEDGANLFLTIEKLALFFAGPVGIFFMTLAGYYYITSAGDEEKVKKAKNIIMNIVIATVILLASHTILKDLITL